MLSEDDNHRKWAEKEIKKCIERYEYSPIIFVGSGISQRYLDAPGWRALLIRLAELCPKIDYPLEYYEEEFEYPSIGSQFIDPYREWAWSDREDNKHFPESVFKSDAGKDKYLKYKVAELFQDISHASIDELNDEYKGEIQSLQNIVPTGIITTNYDTLLETIFSEFEPMVGQEIFEKDRKQVGDLFKIHGCVSDPNSIILTQDDYDIFDSEHMYISAKLTTYFTEHPVLIIGYEPDDPNIRKIFTDLNQMVKDEDNTIKNIFIVDYESEPKNLNGDPDLPRQQTIHLEDGHKTHINSITCHSFEWVFDAFGHDAPMEDVDYETVRRFTSKLYDITTKEAPRKKINFERVNYLSEGDHIEKLLGFVPVDNPDTVDAMQAAGIPIGEGEVSTEPVEEINNRLKTATQDYRSNGTLISDRGVVLEFRKRKSDLDLQRYPSELLLRSSIANGFQGADWMIDGPINVIEVFRKIIKDEKAHPYVIPRVGYNLLILDREDVLDELYEEHPDNGYLKRDLRKRCGKPIEVRVNDYSPSNAISLEDERIEVTSLIGNDDKVDKLLNIVGDIIIEAENSGGNSSNSRVDLRQLELVKIANNIDKIRTEVS